MQSYRQLYHSFCEYLESYRYNGGSTSDEVLLTYDEQEQIHWPFLDLIQKWGYCDYLIPVKHGGKHQDLLQLYLLTKAIAQYDVTVAIVRGLAYFSAIPIWMSGSDQQIDWVANHIRQGDVGSIALTELNHGSDITANDTSAVLKEGFYHINGDKWAINHAEDSFASILLVKTAKKPGPLSYSLMLLDQTKANPGLKTIPRITTHGARGMKVGGFEFNNLRITQDNVIGKVGQGIALTFRTLQISRTLCAGLSSGAAHQSLLMAYDFAQKRKLYQAPIDNLPVVKQRLAECYARYVVADIFSICVMRAASFYPDRLSLWSAQIKYLIPEQTEKIIHQCAKILGARGFMRNHDYAMFQKTRRDHELVGLFDGSSEVNLTIIGQHLVQQAKKRLEDRKETPDLAIFDLNLQIPEFEHQNVKSFCLEIDLLAQPLEIDQHPEIANACQFLKQALKTLDKGILTNYQLKRFNPKDLVAMTQSAQYCWIVSALCANRFCRINKPLRYLQPVVELYLELLKQIFHHEEIELSLYNQVFNIASKQLEMNKTINFF